MKVSNHWKLLVVVVTFAVLAGTAWAFASLNLTITVPVTATSVSTSSTSNAGQLSSAVIQAATIGGKACVISSDSQSAACPGTTIGVGSSESIVVTVRNGAVSISFSIVAMSSNTNSWIVTQDSNNPTILAPGSFGTFQFTASAIAAGTATITISIMG